MQNSLLKYTLALLVFTTLYNVGLTQAYFEYSPDQLLEEALKSKTPELGVYFVDSSRKYHGYIHYFADKELCIYRLNQFDDPGLYQSGSFFIGGYTNLDLILRSDTFLVRPYSDPRNGWYGNYLVKVDIPGSNLDSFEVYGTQIIDNNYYITYCYADTVGMPIGRFVASSRTLFHSRGDNYGVNGFMGSANSEVEEDTVHQIDKVIDKSFHPYHSCVYIDTSRKHSLYKNLNKYRFTNARRRYAYPPARKKYKLNEKVLRRLPKELLELKLYEDQFYLYDSGNSVALPKVFIRNQTFVDYSVNGAVPMVIRSIEEIEPGVYALALEGKESPDKYVLRTLDQGLYLQGRWNGEEVLYDRIMCDATQLYQYFCIINYSRDGKHKEYEFDKPDYWMLIYKYARPD